MLDRYAETVTRGLETLLTSKMNFASKIESLIQFGSEAPEAGCLFVKMRANRSRFGEQTQTGIAVTEAHFLECYTLFFKESAANGEWRGGIAAELAAAYLHEQLGLAISQRAAGKSKESVRELLDLAMSILR
ncbi:MAG: hypothetical protein O3B03_04475 [Proteobacteria bacterium]|nr:hypothetical protein [Pseudomonadota bacterium]